MRMLSKRDVARYDFQLKMIQIELQNCIRAMKGRYGSAEATSNLKAAMRYINLCISGKEYCMKFYQKFRNPPNTPKSRRLGWYEEGGSK